MHNAWAHKNQKGFTIVELLIVIVIIGILAAIIIVAYNGVQQRAHTSAVTIDLTSAYKRLLTYQIDTGSYPTTLAAAGVNQTTGGTTYDYAVNNAASPATFCITGTNGNISYKVSDSISTPVSGGCPGHGVGGVPAITNLATNPSVESGVGWYANNSATVPRAYDPTVARSGVQSVSSSSLSASAALMSLYAVGGTTGNGFPVVGDGGTYTASVYFKAEVANQGRLSYSCYTGGVWSSATYSAWVGGSTSSWTQMSQTFTIPVGTTFLRMGAFVNATATVPAGTKAWVDDMIVVAGGSAANYADGNSPNWIWNGSTNNATSTGPPL